MRRALPILLAALLLAAACGDDADTDASTTTAGPTTTAAEPTTTAPPDPTTTAGPTTTMPEPVGAMTSPTPIDAAFDFIGALGDADMAKAWSLLHADGRGGWDTFEQFESETGLIEGLGEFSALSKDRYQAALFDAHPQGRDYAIVSVWGEVTREGLTEFDVYAIGARNDEDGWQVVFLDRAGMVVTSPPSQGAFVDPEDGVRVEAPAAGLFEVVLVADGEKRSVTVGEGEPEQAVITTTDLSPGVQQVAVAILLTDGTLRGIETIVGL